MKTFYNWMESASSLGAFVDAVIENRTDYGAYMMLADRLEESGDHELAEFLQLALKSHENLPEKELHQIENRFNEKYVSLSKRFKTDFVYYKNTINMYRSAKYFPVKILSNRIVGHKAPKLKAIDLDDYENKAIIFVLILEIFYYNEIRLDDKRTFKERIHDNRVADILKIVNHYVQRFYYRDYTNEELNYIIEITEELENLAKEGPVSPFVPIAETYHIVDNRACYRLSNICPRLKNAINLLTPKNT